MIPVVHTFESCLLPSEDWYRMRKGDAPPNQAEKGVERAAEKSLKEPPRRKEWWERGREEWGLEDWRICMRRLGS
jgi:hypothetical protein